MSPEGRRGTEVDRQEPGSLTVLETFPLRSTEIQETKALPSRAIVWWMFLEAEGYGCKRKGWRKIWKAGVSLL